MTNDPPMIYRKNPRVLPDACLSCGKSETYCHAVREMEGRSCCNQDCRHPN